MKNLYISTNKYFITFLLIVVFFTFFIFYIIKKIDNNENLINNLENNLNTTKYLFEEQKRYALSLSILLSKDEQIIKSFINQDRQKSFKLINKKIKTLKTTQKINFEVQIHNKNLTTYLRSWDITKKDIELSSFRQGLVEVKNSLKPFVSIELGKRLNIKAISPFVVDGKFIGSIETIVGFDNLAKQLKKRGYTLFVLLDNKYLNIATKFKYYPKISNYTIVNKNNIKMLKHLNMKELMDYGYISNKAYSFSYFSYYDLSENRLGYILISIKNKNHIEIKKNYKLEHKNTKKIKII